MVKIAIIGMGIMGKNHYRVLKTLKKDVEIVALCDVASNETFEHKLYKDVDEMLDNHSDIDACIVATPTIYHKQVAIKCLQRDIHLLIEKPVASSLKCANEILQAQSKSKARVVIGHVERFNPVVEALKKEIMGKETYNINIQRVGPFPPRIGDVGVLSDLAVHDIDLIRHITGRDIEDIHIFKNKHIHNHYEDNAVLSFRLSGNVLATITTNWLTPFRKRIVEIACKEAYYEADLMSQVLLEFSNYETNNSFVQRGCWVTKQEPLLRELQDFINLIKNGTTNGASIQDSIITLDVLWGERGERKI